MSVMVRPRMYFDADDELRIAIKQAALREGVSAAAWIEEVLKDKLGPKSLEEARIIVARQKKKPRD